MPSSDSLAVPQHIAIVMDGNGRWANKRYMPRLLGHRPSVLVPVPVRTVGNQMAGAAVFICIQLIPVCSMFRSFSPITGQANCAAKVLARVCHAPERSASTCSAAWARAG